MSARGWMDGLGRVTTAELGEQRGDELVAALLTLLGSRPPRVLALAPPAHQHEPRSGRVIYRLQSQEYFVLRNVVEYMKTLNVL